MRGVLMYEQIILPEADFAPINAILESEYKNLKEYVNLIGSANYPFPSSLKILNTPFNLNPSEGARGKRLFPMCEAIDKLEIMGEELLIELLDCPGYYANLEPYSGTQANQIVYNAILEDNDVVLSLALNVGGHESHLDYIKKYYHLIEYGITDKHEIDYGQIEELCKKYSPKLVIAGFSSFPKQVDYELLGEICTKYNVYLLADISHTFVYVSAKTNISPIPYADFLTFTTHKTTRGVRGGIVLCKNKFKDAIEKSIFPITQGAPKFNEILSKVVMLYELKKMSIPLYVNKINHICNLFMTIFRDKKIDIYTGSSDTHLIIINLRSHNITGLTCEELLKKQGILVNRAPILGNAPNEFPSIRMGVLTLATLEMDDSDCKIIGEIISNTIIDQTVVSPSIVISILEKYWTKIC